MWLSSIISNIFEIKVKSFNLDTSPWIKWLCRLMVGESGKKWPRSTFLAIVFEILVGSPSRQTLR